MLGDTRKPAHCRNKRKGLPFLGNFSQVLNPGLNQERVSACVKRISAFPSCGSAQLGPGKSDKPYIFWQHIDLFLDALSLLNYKLSILITPRAFWSGSHAGAASLAPSAESPFPHHALGQHERGSPVLTCKPLPDIKLQEDRHMDLIPKMRPMSQFSWKFSEMCLPSSSKIWRGIFFRPFIPNMCLQTALSAVLSVWVSKCLGALMPKLRMARIPTWTGVSG